jgi:hypothetical protein
MKGISISITLGIALLFVYFGAASADEFPYDLRGCGTGEVTIIDKAGDMMIGQTITRGVTESIPPDAAFDNMTYECRTVWHTSEGGTEFSNRCTFVDPDGDKTFGMSSGHSKGWQWKFLGGTGKWKGITGGGPAERVGRYGRISPTLQGSCWRGKGTYKLP